MVDWDAEQIKLMLSASSDELIKIIFNNLDNRIDQVLSYYVPHPKTIILYWMF